MPTFNSYALTLFHSTKHIHFDLELNLQKNITRFMEVFSVTYTDNSTVGSITQGHQRDDKSFFLVV